MTDHPLTDAGEQLMPRFFTALDRAIDAQRDAFKESISEALKLGIETGRDKQLEQVTDWLKENLGEWLAYEDLWDMKTKIGIGMFINDLKKAMRPQENIQ